MLSAWLYLLCSICFCMHFPVTNYFAQFLVCVCISSIVFACLFLGSYVSALTYHVNHFIFNLNQNDIYLSLLFAVFWYVTFALERTFNYLDSLLNDNAKFAVENGKCILVANDNLPKLSKILSDQKMFLETTICVLNCYAIFN